MQKKEHGENEVTSPKVNGRGQRSPETACNEGCKEASPTSRAESTQAPSRDRSIKGDPEVSKVNRPVDSEGAVSEAGERNRAGLWIGAEVSVNSGPGTPGSKAAKINKIITLYLILDLAFEALPLAIVTLLIHLSQIEGGL